MISMPNAKPHHRTVPGHPARGMGPCFLFWQDLTVSGRISWSWQDLAVRQPWYAKRMTMTSVSLFSGCLGLDLGLEQAGIRTAVCVENDPACQRTIALNRPGIPIYQD